MASDKYYLTTDPVEEGHPRHGELLAVISLGHPQLGDEEIMVCTVKIVKDRAAADAWYAQQMVEKPWRQRQ